MLSSLKSSLLYIPSTIYSYFSTQPQKQNSIPLIEDYQSFIKITFNFPIREKKTFIQLPDSHFTKEYQIIEKQEQEEETLEENNDLKEEQKLEELELPIGTDDIITENEQLEEESKQLIYQKEIEHLPEEIIKREFYYCTSYGEVRGLLTINSALLMFDPAISFENKEKIQNQRIIKFQVCVDLNDISDVQIVTLPSKNAGETQADEQQPKDYFLQILLLTIGKKQIEGKFGERMIQMKKEKNAMATLFFKIYEKNEQEKCMINSEKLEKIKFVYSKLTKFYENAKKRFQSEENISSTNVPFFDILYENILKSQTLRKMSCEEFSSQSSISKTKGIIIILLSFFIVFKHYLGIYKALPNFIPKLNNESKIIDQKKVLKVIIINIFSFFIQYFYRFQNTYLLFLSFVIEIQPIQIL